jgi:predicted ATP-grasp superfamily ATP-dependent carboligase
VLYPTSDEVAWAISTHRAELSRWFRLYSPPAEALVRLLDKGALGAAARAGGLDAPAAWCPADEADLERLAHQVGLPVVVKPRVQLYAGYAAKAARAGSPAAAIAVWRAMRDVGEVPADVRRAAPGSDLPMLQAWLPGAERVFTVDGFVDASGELYATLGCVKLLQRPRGSGAGLVFQAAPVPPAAADGLRRLFGKVGYFGVFDAEFIEDGDRLLLIDVNPRFYNHMAFEIDRGLPLAWLAYLAAAGEVEALRGELARAGRPGPGPRAYVHRLPARLMLQLQGISGALSAEERAGWRRWMAELAPGASDPVWSAGDPGPALAEVALEVSTLARHPRSWLRKLARGPDAPDPVLAGQPAAIRGERGAA